MAAVSPVDICNVALGFLGVQTITALTDPTKTATLCNSVYPVIRDETLHDAEWNFAQVRVKLAALSAAPPFGFKYAYVLPVSPFCLRVNEVDPDDAVYTIESDAAGVLRTLQTDEPTIYIRYTAQITDPALYSGSFILALATHLAAEIAFPLTETQSIADAMQKRYEVRISRAMTADSQEGSTRIADINALIDVRRHGFEAFDRSRNKFGV